VFTPRRENRRTPEFVKETEYSAPTPDRRERCTIKHMNRKRPLQLLLVLALAGLAAACSYDPTRYQYQYGDPAAAGTYSYAYDSGYDGYYTVSDYPYCDGYFCPNYVLWDDWYPWWGWGWGWGGYWGGGWGYYGHGGGWNHPVAVGSTGPGPWHSGWLQHPLGPAVPPGTRMAGFQPRGFGRGGRNGPMGMRHGGGGGFHGGGFHGR
jgi:hypothetical protein